MKRFTATVTAAMAMFAAPTAHAGYTAQNSSEAAQLSTKAWSGVSSNSLWALTNNPFPGSLADAISAGAGAAFEATLISAYHWVFMTLGEIGEHITWLT